MNGPSSFLSELYTEFYTNYLGGQPLGVPWEGRWVRLSTKKCTADGVGWEELTSSGYTPFGSSTMFFDQLVTSEIGQYVCPLDNDNNVLTDIIFNATGQWDEVLQVGVWGSPTSTLAEHFLMGFEIDPVVINAGERMIFKNVGIGDKLRGIRFRIETELSHHSYGVNAYGNSSSFSYNWVDILNMVSPNDFPALSTAINPSSLVDRLRIAIRTPVTVSWLDGSPARSSVAGESYTEPYLNTFFFEYYNEPLLNYLFVVRNIRNLTFSPSTADTTAASIGVNAVNLDDEESGWGGGPIQNAPVGIELGDISVMLSGDFTFAMKPFIP